LSPRQREILDLVAEGRTSKEIAMSLGISESTVNWHISNAFERLGASSRAEAVALAIRSNGVDRVPEATERVSAAPTPTRPDRRRLVAMAIAIAIFGALLGGATVATLLRGPAGPVQNPTASPRAPTATPTSGVREGLVDGGGIPIDGAVDVGTSPAGSPLPDAPASLVPTISAPPLPSITVPLPTPPLPSLPVTVTPPPLPSLPLPTPIPTPRLALP
jgi:DNA-binding CsgD family transcriptional regulator